MIHERVTLTETGAPRVLFLVAIVVSAAATLGAAAYFGIRTNSKPVPGLQRLGPTAENLVVVSKIHLKNIGPRLKIEEIQAFEREIGGRLPDEYKNFLLAQNGGFAEPKLGFPCKDELIEIECFQQLLPTADGGLRRSVQWSRELNSISADGFLPIAHGVSDKYICLAYRRHVGAVCYTTFKYKKVFRGDLVPVGVTMVPLADSFAEFLGGLIEIPNPYCRIEQLGKRGTASDLAQYLAEGHSIDSLGKNHLTIVREAIRFDNSAMTKACIERKASLSGTVETAVKGQHLHLIQMLVNAGADVNERNEFGHTPLSYVVGTAIPGEQGARNRDLRDLLIGLGAIE